MGRGASTAGCPLRPGRLPFKGGNRSARHRGPKQLPTEQATSDPPKRHTAPTGAKVVTADVAASNGVIHVIDAVILPPSN
jgi:hypothetical protein